jgi:hypothetical protein
MSTWIPVARDPEDWSSDLCDLLVLSLNAPAIRSKGQDALVPGNPLLAADRLAMGRFRRPLPQKLHKTFFRPGGRADREARALTESYLRALLLKQGLDPTRRSAVVPAATGSRGCDRPPSPETTTAAPSTRPSPPGRHCPTARMTSDLLRDLTGNAPRGALPWPADARPTRCHTTGPCQPERRQIGWQAPYTTRPISEVPKLRFRKRPRGEKRVLGW